MTISVRMSVICQRRFHKSRGGLLTLVWGTFEGSEIGLDSAVRSTGSATQHVLRESLSHHKVASGNP
jgi:hypothetical protein